MSAPGQGLGAGRAAQAALAYLDAGYAVIPIKAGTKKPRIKWTAFQTRLPTRAEAEGWWRQWPDAGVGIITGAVSGIVVIDIDPRNGANVSDYEALSPVAADTPSGGLHLYVRYADWVKSGTGVRPGVDVQADKKYVVVAPTQRPDGTR